VPSAVALAEKPGRKRRQGSRLSFHRVSDWATKEEPEIAAALHECDELAVKATEVLRGKALRICMELVMASAAHLLSLVDAPSGHDGRGKKERALRLERDTLDRVRTYYRSAANGQAQLYYFLGLMLGVSIIAVAALRQSASRGTVTVIVRRFVSPVPGRSAQPSSSRIQSGVPAGMSSSGIGIFSFGRKLSP
jgi:hypothetical protein